MLEDGQCHRSDCSPPQGGRVEENDFFFIIQFDLDLYCRHMAQSVSRRPYTAETGIRSQVSACQIGGGQSGIGRGLCPSTSVPPSQYRCTIGAYAPSHLNVALSGRTNGRSLGTFNKAVLFRKSRSIG